MLIQIPAGLDQIIKVYGSLDDARFEQKNIVSFALPYPLKYEGQVVTCARCHHLVVENFVAALSKIKALGLTAQVTNYGGIYARRAIRGQQSHPSLHSWGVAIDLEPALYPLGSKKRFAPEIIAAFRDAGFFYGGDFTSRKDPMHFQLATHY